MSRRLWKICLGCGLLAVVVGALLTMLAMRHVASGNFRPIEGTEEPATLNPEVPGLALATFGVCCLLVIVWTRPQ